MSKPHGVRLVQDGDFVKGISEVVEQVGSLNEQGRAKTIGLKGLVVDFIKSLKVVFLDYHMLDDYVIDEESKERGMES